MLNLTPNQITEQAALDLARKIRLEAEFIPSLTRFFTKVSGDLFTSVSRTGGAQNAAKYRGEMNALLTRQYGNVTASFVNNTTDLVRSLPRQNPLRIQLVAIARVKGLTISEMLDDIALESRLAAVQALPDQVTLTTRQILNTTQNKLDRSVGLAREDGLRGRELAGASAQNNQIASRQRPGVIATTVTQQAAEQAKFFEQERLVATRNGAEARELGMAKVTPEYRWVTQGDSRVRDGVKTPFDHLEADFQKRTGETYTVSGQKLRFPGDTSLGASAGNVIRCRCASILTIQEPTL